MSCHVMSCHVMYVMYVCLFVCAHAAVSGAEEFTTFSHIRGLYYFSA